MAKIIFLGTSSSVPTKTRDNTSLLLLFKNQKILIDAGGSPCHKLEKIGIRFWELKDIIITHLHPDHIYGLVNLIHSQGYLNKYLNLYTHKESITFIKKFSQLFKVYKRHPYPELIFKDVFSQRFFYAKENLKLQAFKTFHTPQSFGIKIYKNSKKIVYTSDTKFSEKLIEECAGADTLIADCTSYEAYFRKHPQLYRMHTSSRQLGYIAEKSKVKKLVPLHFLELEKNTLRTIIKELKKNYRGKIIIPQDFSKIYF